MAHQQMTTYFLSLGYRDYIAARFLLNNEFVMQGVTLASSSVEKYLKFILAYHGKGKKEMGVHLDKLPKLKALLADCYYDVTLKIDERFLDILGKAYSMRYYDNIQDPLSFGFFINQFIGELDFTVNFIEGLVQSGDKEKQSFKSQYRRAAEEKDFNLIFNNYIFQGISKKEHMEKIDNGFAIYLNPTKPHGEVHVAGKGIRNEYDGRMYLINIRPGGGIGNIQDGTPK